MNTSITIAQFELQTNWFLNELVSISDEQSNKKAADNLNPIKWVAGHILNTRMTLLSILTGDASNQEFNSLFGKGSSNKITSLFPTIDEIKLKWGVVSSELSECLKTISNETLESPPPFQTSIPDKTLHGLITYMASHEAFHLGQLSILKKF
ncbi:MAG: DinB family protein [Bacteroidetes bacterium]|nr:DinB family protein [Bacteroidota bacterium]